MIADQDLLEHPDHRGGVASHGNHRVVSVVLGELHDRVERDPAEIALIIGDVEFWGLVDE